MVLARLFTREKMNFELERSGFFANNLDEELCVVAIVHSVIWILINQIFIEFVLFRPSTEVRLEVSITLVIIILPPIISLIITPITSTSIAVPLIATTILYLN